MQFGVGGFSYALVREVAQILLEEQLGAESHEARRGVWEEALLDRKRFVEIDGYVFPVTLTTRNSLKQVDFKFGSSGLRGIEQNPQTKSRWAKMARAGKKVMQFVENGKYVAVVTDGKIQFYKNQSSVG
jgi:hypothetical protein